MDKIEHCLKMIEKEQYLDENSLGREDLWLCKYLKDSGYSVKEAFNIWQKIHINRYGGEKRDTISTLFLSFWNRCDKVVLNCETFAVTKGELEFINRLDMALWKKQYVLYLIAYFKITKGKWLKDYYYPPEAIKHKVKRPNRNEDRGNSITLITDDLLSNGVLECKTDKISGYDEEDEFVQSYYRTRNIADDKEIVFEFSSVDEIVDYLPLIKSEMVCPNCGNKFEISSKTQRCVCEDCWKKEQSKRVMDFNDSHKKPSVLKICKNCGSTFEASSKCKRKICIDCWKKKETERKKMWKAMRSDI